MKPEFISLIDLIERKLFSIPEYQRHYSWTQKERNDLFRDITKLQNEQEKYKDRTHFMATIVCLKTPSKESVGSNTFFVYEVVDGQQRLTTLIILLKTIALKLKELKEEDEANQLNKLLVKDDGRLIILQNNHDNRALLRNYLKNGDKPQNSEIKTVADANIRDGIKDCEKFVNSAVYASPINLVKLLALIKNHLFFIFQYLEDKGAVYTIFEVLNSRGLEVDWLDKCKSMLLGLLYENCISNETLFETHLKNLHTYWSNIYTEIGLQRIQGQEVIRFAATLKYTGYAAKPMPADEALEFFRKDCTCVGDTNKAINKIEENTLWLRSVTEALSELNKNKRIKAVTDITQARLLAVAIAVRKDLSESDRKNLLEQWERTTFKIYGILDKDARNKVGDYVRAAKIIHTDLTSSVEHFIRIIANIGADFPIQTAIQYLRNRDCYTSWKQELRYFFYRYEEYISKNSSRPKQIDDVTWEIIWQNNLNETIEHILPQDKSENCWSSIFNDEDHKNLLNSLGNLCLLSQELNSEAKNNCFAAKKSIYKSVNLLHVKEFIYSDTEDVSTEIMNWTPEAIKQRTDKLLLFAEEQWKDL